MRATSTRARSRTATTASAGTTPSSAQAAIAAISTSSHRVKRRSSDQTAPMAPSRMPNHAGMNTSKMPTTAITIVEYAMKVWIGVTPLVVFRLNLSAM